MSKPKRKGELTHPKDIPVIKMLREGKGRRDLITATFPEDCHLQNNKFMALVIMAEIAEETGQDIIPCWQICRACKITECPHKK